jgi:lipid-A-disaccharide synthase
VKTKAFMLIAGEASGDLLAAELVGALRERVLWAESGHSDEVQPLRTRLAPHFFGAGGPRMAAAGVDLAFDLTPHSVIGVGDPVRKSQWFLRRLIELRKLAIRNQPDAIILVDFSFFNHLFARILRRHLRRQTGPFNNWKPKIVKFVSPQVWASRPGRAYRMAQDFDLLLSIFPFEKAWYAKRVPKLRVEFVGHPMADRFAGTPTQSASIENRKSQILLLPGSRPDELRRHLPAMLGALKLIQAGTTAIRASVVLPDEFRAEQAGSLGLPADVDLQVGRLPEALAQADVAIASTGTVTMECAFFGVPTVALYRTSWTTYEIAKRLVTVKYLAMPNLLANEEVFPEFIQHAATPENIARAALELLRDDARRASVKAKLARVVASLGGPGASARAAAAIVRLLR